MKSCSFDSRILWTLRQLVGFLGYLLKLQVRSSRGPLNNSFSYDPQVTQRIQREQLSCVMEQASVTSLAKAKLAFDHSEGILHFGPNAVQDLLQLVDQGVYSCALLQNQVLTKHHGNLPVYPRVHRINLFALGDSPIAGVCEYKSFFTVQQSVGLRDFLLVCGNARKSMNQVRLSVCANVSLHTEVPLVGFLGRVHLWVALTRIVLGLFRSGNQSSINDHVCFEQQAPHNITGVHGDKNLRGKVVGFKKVTETENCALIRQTHLTRMELDELTEQDHIVQGLYHARITQAKPLLQKMVVKHCGNGKRWTPRFAYRRKGLDQSRILRPRHNKIQLVKKFSIMNSLGRQFKLSGREGDYFNDDITFKSGGTVNFAELPLLHKINQFSLHADFLVNLKLLLKL